MADTPNYRPQAPNWRGYFVSEYSSRAVVVDEDSRVVAARVRHLRHVAAERAARTDAEQHHPTAVRAVDTALFEDTGLFDDGGRLRPRRLIADPSGGDLRIGANVDDLMGRYGMDSVGHAGQYGSGPLDPRGFWRTGMAKQELPQDDEEAGTPFDKALLKETKAFLQQETLRRHRADLEELQRQGKTVSEHTFRYIEDELARLDAVIAEARAEQQQAELQKEKDRKPRPDDDGHLARRLDEAVRHAMEDLLKWGSPAMDLLEARQTRPLLSAAIRAALWNFIETHPARYDRLGRIAERRALSDRERRSMLSAARRRRDAATNWGDGGPPRPPGPASR